MRGWTDWIGTPADLARRLAFATAAGVFLGLLGPFGSYDVPTAVRVASWTTSFWAGSILLGLAVRAAYAAEAVTGLPTWFALPAATVVAAAPLAAIAWAIFHALAPHLSALDPLTFYFQTVAVAAPVSLGYLAVMRRVAPPPADATPALPPGRPPSPAPTASAETPAPRTFLDRLPPRLGRDLLAPQMEDHYVRAHTSAGSDLVLIPLRQAIDELGERDGLRTHRCWWVARDAVERVREDGRNLRLVLKGGLEAPVARANVAALREAGWLAE